MKKIFLGLFLILTVFAFGCSDKQSSVASSSAKIGAQVGEKLKENTFVTLDGQKINLPPKDGKVYVLNLWATWCPPCRAEMPELQAFYNKYKNDTSVGLYLINYAEDAKTINAFLKENNYSMPVVIDNTNVTGEMFMTRGIPTTVVLDKQGIVVFRKVGPVTLNELEEAINKVK